MENITEKDKNYFKTHFKELEEEEKIDHYERGKWKRNLLTLKRDWFLYIMLIPLLLVYIYFHYRPMAGILLAFKKFEGSGDLATTFKAQWYGFYALDEIMFSGDSVRFWRAFRNTFTLSTYGLLFGFPIPIFLALMFNEIKNEAYRSLMQILTYLPKFISTVVVTSLLLLMLSPGDNELVKPGILTQLLNLFGLAKDTTTPIMQNPAFFRSVFVTSGIWSDAGYGSIVYFAAIMAIDPTKYEAAKIDGASKLDQIRHVTLPGMAPTLIIMIILRIGGILSVGYEKVLLMVQTSGEYVLETAEVISLYVLRMGGLISVNTGGAQNLDPTTARGIAVASDLFNAVIAMALVLGANFISRRVSETSLF